MQRRSALFVPILFFGLGAPACDKTENAPPPAETKKSADAGAPHASGVEKDIVEAVNQVAGGSGAPGAPAGGPPQNGIFAPGVADRELLADALPKIALGSKGSGATVHFEPPKLDRKLSGKVTIAVQMGPRAAMPTVELSLSIEASAPAPAESSAPGPSAAAARTLLTARVTAAKPAAEQPGELPPGTDRQIAKFKGSRIRIEVGPNGGGKIVGIEPSKDMETGLAASLNAAGEALVLAFLPYPSDPVGAGAYWMVTSRESYAGLDVVAYRMVKLDAIDGDTATLNISTKRYVAGGKLAFEGLPPHHLDEFNGSSTGSISVHAADTEAVHGQSDDTLLAALSPMSAPAPAGGQPQHLQVHLEFRSELAIGG